MYMQILTVTNWDEERQFATLSFGYNRRFTDFLKLGIRPESYREYDSESRRWRVHLSKLPLALNFARRHFAQVDYRTLPEWVQMLVAAAKEATGGPQEIPSVTVRLKENPYMVMHLLPTAPWDVVKAAYKALAYIHHPDRGGNEIEFKRINNAYSELEKKHNEEPQKT